MPQQKCSLFELCDLCSKIIPIRRKETRNVENPNATTQMKLVSAVWTVQCNSLDSSERIKKRRISARHNTNWASFSRVICAVL
jgi:hypothetical protein